MMHDINIQWLLISAILALWLIGIVRFWRLQSHSRATVTVTGLDRLMVIFWLPLYAFTIVVLVTTSLWRGLQRTR